MPTRGRSRRRWDSSRRRRSATASPASPSGSGTITATSDIRGRHNWRMAKALAFRVFAALALGGCAVMDQQYPASWDPLPPAMSANCAAFAGSYADRGEMTASANQPSLTYGLFGHHGGWQKVRRVDFAFPHPDVLEVTAWDAEKPLFTRQLSANAGDFACKQGRLVVRSKRW